MQSLRTHHSPEIFAVICTPPNRGPLVAGLRPLKNHAIAPQRNRKAAKMVAKGGDMQLIPCYSALSEQFKSVVELRTSNVAALNFVKFYMSQWSFDEEWYLDNNPDLAAAIPSDVFASGLEHFRAAGYFENRLPAKVAVDSSWYMATYPDVAAAIIKGTFESAAQHFLASGYREGRLPSSPDLDAKWYAETYLRSSEKGEGVEGACLDHYIRVGYLNGALPQKNMR